MTNKEKLTIFLLVCLFLFFIIVGSTGIAPGIKPGIKQKQAEQVYSQ